MADTEENVETIILAMEELRRLREERNVWRRATYSECRARQGTEDLHERATDRVKTLRAALGNLIYNVSHLSPVDSDGSYRPIISAAALEEARKAFTP